MTFLFNFSTSCGGLLLFAILHPDRIVGKSEVISEWCLENHGPLRRTAD